MNPFTSSAGFPRTKEMMLMNIAFKIAVALFVIAGVLTAFAPIAQ